MPPDNNVSLNALSVQWSLSHQAKCPVSATVTVTSGKMHCHCYCQIYCLHEIGRLQYVLQLVCCGSLSGELFIAIYRLPQCNAISCKAYFFQEHPWVFKPRPPRGRMTGRNLSPGSLPGILFSKSGKDGEKNVQIVECSVASNREHFEG